jgi:hypothetical protein
MKKITYFSPHDRDGWPHPKELEHYFLAPPSQRWFFERRNDNAALLGEGAYGTERLDLGKGRIDVGLVMWGNRDLGVLLHYLKVGGGHEQRCYSKGDVNRLLDWVSSVHGTLLPVGLFVPYATAWNAVKEFIETDGELPKSIEWIAVDDLPPGTFPDP